MLLELLRKTTKNRPIIGSPLHRNSNCDVLRKSQTKSHCSISYVGVACIDWLGQKLANRRHRNDSITDGECGTDVVCLSQAHTILVFIWTDCEELQNKVSQDIRYSNRYSNPVLSEYNPEAFPLHQHAYTSMEDSAHDQKLDKMFLTKPPTIQLRTILTF